MKLYDTDPCTILLHSDTDVCSVNVLLGAAGLNREHPSLLIDLQSKCIFSKPGLDLQMYWSSKGAQFYYKKIKFATGAKSWHKECSLHPCSSYVPQLFPRLGLFVELPRRLLNTWNCQELEQLQKGLECKYQVWSLGTVLTFDKGWGTLACHYVLTRELKCYSGVQVKRSP